MAVAHCVTYFTFIDIELCVCVYIYIYLHLALLPLKEFGIVILKVCIKFILIYIQMLLFVLQSPVPDIK